MDAGAVPHTHLNHSLQPYQTQPGGLATSRTSTSNAGETDTKAVSTPTLEREKGIPLNVLRGVFFRYITKFTTIDHHDSLKYSKTE